MKNSNAFDKFDQMTRELLRVPHSEVKAKLEAEKAAKKRKKSRKSSACREANDRA